jgi:hypothetical protein
MNYCLTYGAPNDDELIGYTDADGMTTEGRRQISGYVFLLHGGAVSWSSKQQPIVALSTTEAEYIAQTEAAKEALWLRSFANEVINPVTEPTPLRSDNQSAIALATYDVHHQRTKHINIRFHLYATTSNKRIFDYCTVLPRT